MASAEKQDATERDVENIADSLGWFTNWCENIRLIFAGISLIILLVIPVVVFVIPPKIPVDCVFQSIIGASILPIPLAFLFGLVFAVWNKSSSMDQV